MRGTPGNSDDPPRRGLRRIYTFPVVIGEGSHPFPFRTRKLSPLPPMVLRGNLRGRVGHCRDYLSPEKAVASATAFFVFRDCHRRAPPASERGARAPIDILRGKLRGRVGHCRDYLFCPP